MRIIIYILLLFSFTSEAQIINASRPYVPLSTPLLLLNEYPSATIAFSFRKLKDNYSGNCVRIRRSSDNVEQDFGFSNNYLDTASIRTFLTTNSGFVAIWYSQNDTLTAFNATQATAASQPRIFNAGTFEILKSGSSLIAMYFDGGDFLATNNAVFFNGLYTAFSVHRNNSVTGARLLFAQDAGSGTNRGPQFLRTNGTTPQTVSFISNSATAESGAAISNDVAYIFAAQKTSSGMELFVNGSSNGATTQSGNAQNPNTGVYIGQIGDNSGRYDGRMSELLLWGKDNSSNRTGILTNINAYYGIY